MLCDQFNMFSIMAPCCHNERHSLSLSCPIPERITGKGWSMRLYPPASRLQYSTEAANQSLYEKTLNNFAAEALCYVATVTDFMFLSSKMAYAASIGRSPALVAPRHALFISKLWALFRKYGCYAGVSLGHTAAVHTYEMGARGGGHLHSFSHSLFCAAVEEKCI